MKKVLFGGFTILGSVLSQSIDIEALTLDSDKDKIHVSGDTIALSVNGDVEVIGTYAVKTSNGLVKPWGETSVQKGDTILKIDNKDVKSLSDVKKHINNAKNDRIQVLIKRNNKEYKETFTRVKKLNGDYSLGLYVKDKVLGIGTLTYVIEDEGIFGSLGHNLNSDIGAVDGKLKDAELISINKGTKQEVGEKRAKIGQTNIGTIEKNTKSGIHGSINSNLDLSNLPTYAIGKKEDVRKGKATILANVDGNKIEEFDIEIYDVKKQNKKSVKSFKIKVKDRDLLEKTGGIVQGMSGSPIIQDGKIVGAVTHVFVGDPANGYGIYIEWMLEDMGIDVK